MLTVQKTGRWSICGSGDELAALGVLAFLAGERFTLEMRLRLETACETGKGSPLWPGRAAGSHGPWCSPSGRVGGTLEAANVKDLFWVQWLRVSLRRSESLPKQKTSWIFSVLDCVISGKPLASEGQSQAEIHLGELLGIAPSCRIRPCVESGGGLSPVLAGHFGVPGESPSVSGYLARHTRCFPPGVALVSAVTG